MHYPITSGLVRSLNRTAVLNSIRQDGPLSRAEIARRLGLSLPVVMRIVDELMAEGLVRTTDHLRPSGGRKRPLIEFNPSAYAVASVDLGGSKMFGIVADLAGQVQHEIYCPFVDGDHAQALDQLQALIAQLLAMPRPAGQHIRGIGVGAPGITRNPEGVIEWSPNVNWREVPLKDILSRRFALPVFVENDVNLAALGEWAYGAGQGCHNLVSIAIGTGAGSGIIIGDALVRGRHHAAGEIGYLPTDVNCLGKCYDQFGAFETVVSGPGIAQRGREALAHSGDTVPEHLGAEAVFAAARHGEAWATQTIADTVDHLAVGIAAVSVLLDPEVIVLAGGVARSADLLIEPVQRRLEGVIPYVPRLVASPLDRYAVVLGGVAMVMNGTIGFSAVERAV